MPNIDIDLELWKRFIEYPKLGELLLQHKKITINQLSLVLDEQEKQNLPVGQLLIDMNIITKNELVEVLEIQSTVDKILNNSYIELQKLKYE